MRVDVVTAAHAPNARYLTAAWSSLRAQTHRDWRWLIQIDGADARPLQAALRACGAAGDPRVSVGVHSTTEGPAVSRNVALGRSTAPLIQNLDADDELEPSALADLSLALDGYRLAGFAAGQARDLLPSGELRSAQLPLSSGRLARGVLLEHWSTAPGGYRLPIHPAGVMWRRDLLVSLGGWSAMRGMEDTGTLMAASARAAGVLIAAPTLRYRKHPGQISGQKSNFAGGGAQISLIRQRALHLLTAPAWAPSSPPSCSDQQNPS
ncbi:glycosyltransferase family 2 protein [Streptomyces radicis]|uniref:Glycosyltransferase n=1 Tax=Streptomyces radicis TaxID=1750517 RepID=A0A3A9WD65_9ACTN|nr:glycosyltransferase [Streptomyces radicis]RKN10612.1 glycosyltransferase [Streptomyces radicis]